MRRRVRAAGARRLLLAGAGCCVLGGPLAAQPAVPLPAELRHLDEITVEGRRSPRALRTEIGKATEDFWALVSAAIDDEDYKITCERVKPTGTLISQRVCMTKFQRDELRKSARAFNDGEIYDPVPGVAHKNAIFNDKMIAAINASPDLQRAVRELARLKNAYDAQVDEQADD